MRSYHLDLKCVHLSLLGDGGGGSGGRKAEAVFLEFSNKTIYLTTTTNQDGDDDDEMRTTANYILSLFCIGIFLSFTYIFSSYHHHLPIHMPNQHLHHDMIFVFLLNL